METLIILLVLLINLSVCFGLIILSYLLAIKPMQEQLKALSKPQSPNRIQLPVPNYLELTPTNDLPDMEDMPVDAFYGDEGEDYKTTPEDMGDAIAERSHNTYNRPQTTSKQQLGSLKM